jgi:hypothetical protein
MSSFLTNPEDILPVPGLAARWLAAMGLTASAAEINALDGIVANVGELNKLSGFLGSVHSLNSLVPSVKCRLFDDFLGDVLADNWAAVSGTDDVAADAVINVQPGGVVRLVCGDSNTSLAADGSQLHSALNWRADKGNLVFEARVKIDNITDVQLFVGLTDQVAALEMPVTLSGTTYTTVATDAVGFLFDTNATTDTIRLVGVANDVDATHQDSAQAYANATWKRLRIELTAAGAATFYIDGAAIGTQMAGAVTPTVALTPVICCRALAAVTRNIDVDYILVEQNR